MVRFVHFADLHVDHYQRGKRGDKFPLRVYDMLAHLDSIISFSIDKKVDFVMFAGDMYHTHLPRQEIRTEVHERILRLVDAGIPFYAVPGNHDMIKRETAKDALYELTSLRVPGVHVFHEPGFIDCGDYAVVGIPWLYYPPDIASMNLPKKPKFALVHATILGALYGSGRDTSEIYLGKEFVMSLDDLMDFEYVGLGHIHRPQVLCLQPYVCYPGSVGWQSWGEAKDDPHTFVFYDRGKIKHIPFEDRPRYKYELALDSKVPAVKDPDAFYKFVIPEGYPQVEIDVAYAGVYSLEVNIIRERTQRRLEQGTIELAKLTHREQLQKYFELTDQDFGEISDLFDEISEDLNEKRT